MKKQIKRNLLLIIFASLLFTGCATWQNATGIQKINSQKITLDLKNNKWHALDNENFETYYLTKDGILLQHILIKRVDLDKALVSSKKTIPEDILSHELAELIIEDLKLENGMNAFHVISNQPEQIDSQDGVQIISEVKDPYDNLIKMNSTYFIFDKKLYIVNYTAPIQHYYKKDLDNYLNIKKSIKLSL